MASSQDLKRNLKIIYIIVAIVGLIILSYISIQVIFSKTNIEPKTEILQNTKSIAEGLSSLAESDKSVLAYIGNIIGYSLKYLFGIDYKENVSDSDIIILISIWFVFFLILKDLISTFGMLEKRTSILIGLLLSVIIANIGIVRGLLGALMKLFVAAADLSVILVLGSIIVFALASHLGISSLGELMMKRKAMLEASKMEAGGTSLAGTIRGLNRAGKALKED